MTIIDSDCMIDNCKIEKITNDVFSKQVEDYFKSLTDYYEDKPRYIYEECLYESIIYFDGDELAAKVFLDKYALRDEEGELLEKTPTDMHHRIAKEIYRIESKKFKYPISYEKIFELLDHFKWIVPQGSPMYGIGNPYQIISLSNCFVLRSPEDSYCDICRADQELVQISKRRGGVGLDISNLRPEGTITHNAARTSTGIIPFVERYSNSTREVGQSGRRGALMVSLFVHHPEVLKFANIKRDLKRITGANLSIRVSDEFMEAVENDTDFELRWPVDSKNPSFSKMVRAKDVWDNIIENAHTMAEPGVLFWDNIISESPADCYSEFGFKTVGTNPCAELPLCADDSCRLLLLNLYSFVTEPFTKNAKFDYDKFYGYSKIAQRMMDDIIDIEEECLQRIINKINKDPESDFVKFYEFDLWKRILNKCSKGRRTGTGITAVGDTLAALSLPYISEEGKNTSEKIYKTLKLAAYRSSVDMAKELGPFDVWDYNLEKDNPFLLRIKEEDEDLYEDMKKYGRRNISLLTTAPTGSCSLMTQTSGGIEPEFSVVPYIRRKKGNPGDKDFRSDFIDQSGDHWMEFLVVKPKLKDWAKANNLDINWDDSKLKNNIQNQKWLNSDAEKPWDNSPWAGSCAGELNWKDRVELQGRIQKNIDHSISSTLNVSNDIIKEEVSEIYLSAWKNRCKGITIYRDGCRTGVMVKQKDNSKKYISKTDAPKRPKELPCSVHHITVNGEQYFVLVGLLEGEPYEVFAGKNGYIDKKIITGKITKESRGRYSASFEDGAIVKSINDFIEDDQAAITRMLSTSLRHGVDINYLVHQLQKIKGDNINSFARSIARALKKHIKDGTKISGETCSVCEGNNLEFKEGCHSCRDCGYSKCM